LTALRPEATRAVLVGIDAYKAGRDWDLYGSVAGAAQVAEWLLACGVPADQLTCVLVPRDEVNDAQAPAAAVAALEGRGVSVLRDASRDALEDIFIDGLGRDGDLLFVFWSGHGVLLDDEADRALFTADATPENKRNIRVQEVLRYLTSGTAARFCQQLLLFDACANPVEQLGGPAPPVATWPHSNRSETKQFVLFSAAQGQIADNGTRFQGFVNVALESLQGHGWPPDPVGLARRVEAHFADLRDKGLTRQMPVSLWRGDSEGESRLRNFGGPPVGSYAREAAAASGFTVAQIRRLAKVISEVPTLQTDQGRRAFVGRIDWLFPEMDQPTLAGDTPGDVLDFVADVLKNTTKATPADVLGRLTSALKTSDDTEADRLARLQVENMWRLQLRAAPVLHAFGRVGADQMRRAYYAVVPDRQLAPDPDELDAALEYLASLAWDRRPWQHPLLRFVSRLEYEANVCMDTGWFRLDDEELARLRNSVGRTTTIWAHLIINVSPGVLGNHPGSVAGHLQREDGQWDVFRVPCGMSRAAMENATRNVLDWAHGIEERNLTLGFLVPRARFDLVPELWTYSDGMSPPAPLENDYPVVLHCADRLAPPRTRPQQQWQRRAKEIARYLHDSPPGVRWLLEDDLRSVPLLRDLLDTTTCVGLGPWCNRGQSQQDPLLAVVKWGAPYLIWYEGEAEAAVVAQTMEQVTAQGGFDELPLRLYAHVAGGGVTGAEGAAPPHIRIIWDSPNWLPRMEEDR
jgi:hypothetical protein